MIYFAQACGGDNLIKIGLSADPLARFSSLATSSPYELDLLRVTVGEHDEERRLHSEFSVERVRGEWFFPSDRLVEYIAHVPQVDLSQKISKPYPVYAPVDTPAPRTRLFYQQERLALEAKRREFSAALRRRLAEKKETIAQAKRALAIEEQEAALEAELEIHKQRLLLKQKKKEEQLRHLRELAEAWNPKPTPILPFPPLSPERMTPELEELMRQAEAFRELGRR